MTPVDVTEARCDVFRSIVRQIRVQTDDFEDSPLRDVIEVFRRIMQIAIPGNHECRAIRLTEANAVDWPPMEESLRAPCFRRDGLTYSQQRRQQRQQLGVALAVFGPGSGALRPGPSAQNARYRSSTLLIWANSSKVAMPG